MESVIKNKSGGSGHAGTETELIRGRKDTRGRLQHVPTKHRCDIEKRLHKTFSATHPSPLGRFYLYLHHSVMGQLILFFRQLVQSKATETPTFNKSRHTRTKTLLLLARRNNLHSQQKFSEFKTSCCLQQNRSMVQKSSPNPSTIPKRPT